MIRDATLDDVPLIIEIGRRLHAESPRFSRLAFNDEKAANFIRFLIDGPHGWVMVGEKDGRIVGGMAAVIFEEWFSTEKVASDISLFVLPEHRGGMLGARLIRAYKDWAAASGARYALAGVSTGIQPRESGLLYERMGAVHVGPLVEFDLEA